ncbi:MAG TPA: ABC-2 family transporter protein, partial [Pirellulaceae bacterium]|nr:ABC-2 family transporter protein [Pirellulaceae bacterium]
GVFLTFAKNSLVRDMTFRTNFVIECISSLSWIAMNLGFYLLVFQHATEIGKNTGWGRYEFFVFLATTWIINSLVEMLFMNNCEEFSELIRSGRLDFALLKPIDTQFLISLQRIEWSALPNLISGCLLLAYSMWQLMANAESPLTLTLSMLMLYPLFILCGVVILYSLMISLAATSIWLGRNQSLYDFWFYITNFSRYPMEIYGGPYGTPLRIAFTYILPVMVVINVPARILAQPLGPHDPLTLSLALMAPFMALGCFFASRLVFTTALRSYRSASS